MRAYIQKKLNLNGSWARTYSTIYALSSGQGKCGVSVIRISGREAKETVLKMTKFRSLPEARKALITPIYDPLSKIPIDRSLLLWFPGPKSFTGEDVCELQVHGGGAVVRAVLSALSKLNNYRPAEPGEFTKRAFIGGKMDLTEVEGLADLIHAETEQQRRQALLQMEGNLGKLYKSWRDILLKSIAHIEAYIDFSEEENIEDDILGETKRVLEQLAEDMKNHLDDGRRGERLHNGVRTVILGEPNVGKSSLLNFLVQRPAAIVTSKAGTTRDIVETNVDIGGFPLLLADTAGLRSKTSDEVELEGIRRARTWAKTADLILLVADSQKVTLDLTKKDLLLDQLKKLELNRNTGQEVILVLNKIDLITEKRKKKMFEIYGDSAAYISCTSFDGMSSFISKLKARLAELCGEPSSESPTLTQERHRFNVAKCCSYLNLSLSYFSDRDISLAAHHLRKAQRNLGLITGHTTTDDILDIIFRDFCVGK